MASLNKVMLIGGSGRDPEISYTPAGMAIAKLALATTETWNDKATGEKKEKSEWHRVSFFGKQAETIGKYVFKGQQLYVEGRLQTSSYEKDGITRYTTEIIANHFQFIGSKKQEQGQTYQQPQQNNGFQAPQCGFKQPQNNGFQQPQRPQNEPAQPDYGQDFNQPPIDLIPF